MRASFAPIFEVIFDGRKTGQPSLLDLERSAPCLAVRNPRPGRFKAHLKSLGRYVDTQGYAFRSRSTDLL